MVKSNVDSVIKCFETLEDSTTSRNSATHSSLLTLLVCGFCGFFLETKNIKLIRSHFTVLVAHVPRGPSSFLKSDPGFNFINMYRLIYRA